MTPTRERRGPGALDTGAGSAIASRPDVWSPAPTVGVLPDSGVGSVPAARLDLFDGSGGAGSAIPPLWL